MNVLLTGATGTLGSAIVRGFWKEGHSVGLVGRDKPALKQLQSEFLDHARTGQVVMPLVYDLSSPYSWQEVVLSFTLNVGDVDVLIHCAAIQGPLGPSWECDRSEFMQTLQVNLIAPIELTRIIVPGMRKRHFGKILYIAGGGACGPRPFVAAYATAKCGLVRWAETLAAELADTGIDVNCISPGPMRSKMTQKIVEAGPEVVGVEEYSRAECVWRNPPLPVWKAVELCLELCKKRCNGITGRIISAIWDDWGSLHARKHALADSEQYTLRRIP